MRVGTGLVLATLTTLTALACGKFSPTDAEEQDGGMDAGSSDDARSIDDGSSIDGAASTLDGTFEGTGAECGEDWTGERGLLSYGQPHNGKQSCRVCEASGVVGAGLDVYLLPKTRITVPAGSARVSASAWVRFASQVDAGSSVTTLRLQPYDAAGFAIGTPLGPITYPLTSSWFSLSFEGTLPPETTALEMRIAVQIGGATCVEIDDVTVALSR
jgi:hypothetical protein